MLCPGGIGVESVLEWGGGTWWFFGVGGVTDSVGFVYLVVKRDSTGKGSRKTGVQAAGKDGGGLEKLSSVCKKWGSYTHRGRNCGNL